MLKKLTSKFTPWLKLARDFAILALRTVKAELICGLAPGQALQTAAQDSDWMVNGRWGVIQFSAGS